MSDRRGGLSAPTWTRRILLVEDDYVIADDLRRELESQGAVVLGPVSSVRDGLALLTSEHRPDLALLDVKLGDEMVFPLADELRRRDIPLIFATGYGQQDLPDLYADVPRCEKPLSMPQLLQALERCASGP